jgi:hypothetical protein
MTIKGSGRSALILATGLWVCLAGPSQAAAGANNAVASAKPESAAAAPIALNKHHWGKHAHRKSSDVALKSSTDNKTAVADDGDNAPIPPSVANANAQLPSSDVPGGSAQAMSVRASNILQAAPNNPADAEPAMQTQVVSADQLNDVDRALHESTPAAAPAQATAPAEAPVARAAPVVASGGESSTWDQTSLIGKIFIGFGALLTVASAARMFMA